MEINFSTLEANKSLTSKPKNSDSIDKIKKLSEEFESIFLEIVLKSMRSSVEKSDFIDGGNGEDIFQSMLDGEYAKQFSHQRSTGLAEAIEKHLLAMAVPAEFEGVNAGKDALARYRQLDALKGG